MIPGAPSLSAEVIDAKPIREHGSLRAGRGPASLEARGRAQILHALDTVRVLACPVRELRAWGPCGWWLRGPPPLRGADGLREDRGGIQDPAGQCRPD